MLISEAFPSEFLKAADLHDRQHTLTMDHIEMREIGDDGNKPVLFFHNKTKGLVLNKTNANNIALVYGDETDNWVDQDVIIYPTMVDFQGRSVPAIRVKVPPRVRQRQTQRDDFSVDDEHPPRNGAPRPGPKVVAMTTAKELNDDIPF